MPQYCCIRGCNNNRNTGVHLFKFPLTKETLLEKWIVAMNLMDSRPTKYSVICSRHFTPNDYQQRPHKQGVRLKQNAVPSILGTNVQEYVKPVDVVNTQRCIASIENNAPESVFQVDNNMCIGEKIVTPINRKRILYSDDHNYSVASTSSMTTKDIDTPEVITYIQKKKSKIMSSSMVHCKNQELTPRKKRMQRRIKTLQQKLIRKDKTILSLKELLETLRYTGPLSN